MSAADERSSTGQVDVAPHWQLLQKIARNLALGFSDPRRIVQLAQSPVTFFDHRELDPARVTQLVLEKRSLLQRAFGVDPFAIPELRESPYSVGQSLHWTGDLFVSTSTFWHAGFLMRILDTVDIPKMRVLEIGGGYGGLAMLWKYSDRCAQYVIVDIMESLFYSYSFLKLTFPKSEICFAHSLEDFERSRTAEFVLLDTQNIDVLADRNFDIVVNTGSFQEMPISMVRRFMELVENKINTRFFYSMNYIFEPKNTLPEARNIIPSLQNLTSPEVDKNWRIEHFEINPPHFTVDSDRNWAEILLRRELGQNLPGSSTNEVLQALQDLEFASQDWFAMVWMSLWRQPTRQLVDLYIAGIQAFVTDRCPIPSMFSKPSRNYNNRKSLFENIGEVIYWKSKKSSLNY